MDIISKIAVIKSQSTASRSTRGKSPTIIHETDGVIETNTHNIYDYTTNVRRPPYLDVTWRKGHDRSSFLLVVKYHGNSHPYNLITN